MAEELRVTWIAPTIPNLPALAWLNELGRISKIPGVTVTTRTGDKLVLDDIAQVLTLPCQILVWSGHGTPGGLCLPDGSFVRTKWLATQVSRGCRPKVAILATCGSQLRDADLRSLTETICRCGINVIGFPTAADDMAAGRFTIEYIRALAINAGVVAAFDVALESISGEKTAGGVMFTPGISDQPFFLETTLLHMTEVLDRLDARLSRSSAVSVPPSSSLTSPSPSSESREEEEARPLSGGGIQSIQRVTRGAPKLGHILGLSGPRHG